MRPVLFYYFCTANKYHEKAKTSNVLLSLNTSRLLPPMSVALQPLKM